MEVFLDFFTIISGLGKTIMIPLMITLIGLMVKCPLNKALKGGITVGIGLIGIDLVMGLVYTYVSPVANLLVSQFGLTLSNIDIGWASVSGLAFSTTVGTFIIPFILVINIIMLSLGATKTINIDIWNYWHYALTGSIVFISTKNLLYGFLAATLHCVIALVTADRTAEKVQKEMHLPGVSIPQGFAVAEVPVALLVDKIFDLFSKKEENEEKKYNKITESKILKILADPIYIGLIIGSILGFLVGYGFKDALVVGMSMAALMFLLPRMVKVLMEGLVPISNSTKAYMTKKYKGQQFYIGMDSAILLGHPTTLAVGLILIPCVLLLAMILPGNTIVPMAGLAGTAYFVAMPTVIHKGKFSRVLISGIVVSAIGLLVGSCFAPYITEFAMTGALTIPEGAGGVSSLSAQLYSFLPFVIFKLKYIGAIIIVAIILVLIYWNRCYLKSKECLGTVEFKNADASSYKK